MEERELTMTSRKLHFGLLILMLLGLIKPYSAKAEETKHSWLPVVTPNLGNIQDPTVPMDNERRFLLKKEIEVADWYWFGDPPANTESASFYWLGRSGTLDASDGYRKSHLQDEPCDRTGDLTSPPSSVNDVVSTILWYDAPTTNFDADTKVIITPMLYGMLHIYKYGQNLLNWGEDPTVSMILNYGYHSGHKDVGNGRYGVCIIPPATWLEENLLSPLHIYLVRWIKDHNLNILDDLSEDLREEVTEEIVSILVTPNTELPADSPFKDKIIQWFIQQLAEIGGDALADKIGFIGDNKEMMTGVVRSAVDIIADNIEAPIDDAFVDLFIRNSVLIKHEMSLYVDRSSADVLIKSESAKITIDWSDLSSPGATDILIYRIKKHSVANGYVHEWVNVPISELGFTDNTVECGYSYDYWFAVSNNYYPGNLAYTTPVHSSWIRIKEDYKPKCEGETTVPYIYTDLEQDGFPMYGKFKLYNPNGQLIADLKCQPGGNMDVMFVPNSKFIYDAIEYSMPKNGFRKVNGSWKIDQYKPCHYMFTHHSTRKGMYLGVGSGWESMYANFGDLFYFGSISDPPRGAVIGNYTQLTQYVMINNKPVKVRTFYEPPARPKVKLLTDFAGIFTYPDQPTKLLKLQEYRFIFGPYLTIRKNGVDITPKTDGEIESLIMVEPSISGEYEVALWRDERGYQIVPESAVDSEGDFNQSTYVRSLTDTINDIHNRQGSFKLQLNVYIVNKDGVHLVNLDKPIWPYQPFPPVEPLLIRPDRYFLPSATLLAAENLRVFNREDVQIYPAVSAASNEMIALVVEGTAPLGWTYTTTNIDSVIAERPDEQSVFNSVQTAVKLVDTTIVELAIDRRLYLPLIFR